MTVCFISEIRHFKVNSWLSHTYTLKLTVSGGKKLLKKMQGVTVVETKAVFYSQAKYSIQQLHCMLNPYYPLYDLSFDLRRGFMLRLKADSIFVSNLTSHEALLN